MKWLQQFKEIVDNNPSISDAELFRAFPELRSDPQRLTAALMYWRYSIVAPEFKKINWVTRLAKMFRKWL